MFLIDAEYAAFKIFRTFGLFIDKENLVLWMNGAEESKLLETRLFR